MIKQLLVSSCVLFSATFVVQAQNPKLGVSPIQDVINAMTLDEKIQLVVGSSGKYESQMEATIGNQGQLVQGAAGQVNGIERLGIPATVVADGPGRLFVRPEAYTLFLAGYATHGYRSHRHSYFHPSTESIQPE